MIQRVTACRTFILSKVWFIANFMVIKEPDLKDINCLIFKFIWGSSIELVKRNSLILPYEKGGLNMVHLKSKLKCIALQQFNYISVNYKRVAYNLSLYWMKSKLRVLKLNNYNIIPEGDDRDRPKEYIFLIKTVGEYKKLNQEYTIGNNNLNSKKVYERFKEICEIRMKVESLPKPLEWENIYKNIYDKNLDSKLKEINFKVLNNGLNLSIKYSDRLGNKCFLCKRNREIIDHLFLDCVETKTFFQIFKKITKNESIELNKDYMIYGLNMNEKENKNMSIF